MNYYCGSKNRFFCKGTCIYYKSLENKIGISWKIALNTYESILIIGYCQV